MEPTPEGSDTSDRNPDERVTDFRTILALAQTLRAEFGVSIDAHPGGVGSEAGAINRAFRATVRMVLEGHIPPGDMSNSQTRALRQAGANRLAVLGVEGERAARLLDMEPGLGDAWLAYLALAPASVIEDLFNESARG